METQNIIAIIVVIVLIVVCMMLFMNSSKMSGGHQCNMHRGPFDQWYAFLNWIFPNRDDMNITLDDENRAEFINVWNRMVSFYPTNSNEVYDFNYDRSGYALGTQTITYWGIQPVGQEYDANGQIIMQFVNDSHICIHVRYFNQVSKFYIDLKTVDALIYDNGNSAASGY